jgi:hypothetical protein
MTHCSLIGTTMYFLEKRSNFWVHLRTARYGSKLLLSQATNQRGAQGGIQPTARTRPWASFSARTSCRRTS